MKCEEGWIIDGKGHCIKVYTEVKSWFGAKKSCEDHNAYLAIMSDDIYFTMVRVDCHQLFIMNLLDQLII